VSTGILFLIVPAAQEADFTNYVRDSLAVRRRSSVRILTDAISASYSTNIKTAASNDLIENLSAFAPALDHRLIVHRDTQCNFDQLKAWWASQGFQPQNCHQYTHTAIKRVLKEVWESAGYHWRTHSIAQANNFDGPKISIDAWVQQFAELGHPKVGRMLAAQLRVIRPMDMPNKPFALRPTDVIGLTQANCYVQDNDIGGSWLDIQASLSHAHPKESVFAVHWDKAEGTLTFPDVNADQFVLHEDGLWSGSEAVRRLKALKQDPPNAQVVMKFGLVSDFGLHVIRHAIRTLGLMDRVQIDPSASEFMQFLIDEVPDDLRLGLNLSLEEYFEILHRHTSPHAFNPGIDWVERDRDACREIAIGIVVA
jgi:hypothetical protein